MTNEVELKVLGLIYAVGVYLKNQTPKSFDAVEAAYEAIAKLTESAKNEGDK